MAPDDGELSRASIAEDIETMKGVAAGDDESLVRLWEKYRTPVQAVVARKAYMWNLQAQFGRDVAEDFIVDAITLAYEDIIRNPEWWDPQKGWSLLTFFCTSASQKLSRLREQESARQEIPRRMREEAYMLLDVEDDPEGIALCESEQKELQKQVYSAIATLSQNLQQPIMLRYRQEMSFVDIATELGITVAAAKQRVYRAIKALKSELIMRGLKVQ